MTQPRWNQSPHAKPRRFSYVQTANILNLLVLFHLASKEYQAIPTRLFIEAIGPKCSTKSTNNPTNKISKQG